MSRIRSLKPNKGIKSKWSERKQRISNGFEVHEASQENAGNSIPMTDPQYVFPTTFSLDLEGLSLLPFLM
jgi:hypothetical protein